MSQQRWQPPAYLRIADDIRRKIQRGTLVGGSKLPSERELCEQWKVSTITVRKALETLRSEGLIYSLRGKGIFVRKAEPLRRIAPQRYWRPHEKATYYHEAETANRSVSVEAQSRIILASDPIAARLGIKRGDRVQRVIYLIRMDDQPVSSSECWEPLHLTEGTPIEDPTKGPLAGTGIVPRFDSIGIHVDGVREELTNRMPTPVEAETLEIPPGVPVTAIEQTFRAGNTVVETADIVFAADRYTLIYDMEVK